AATCAPRRRHAPLRPWAIPCAPAPLACPDGPLRGPRARSPPAALPSLLLRGLARPRLAAPRLAVRRGGGAPPRAGGAVGAAGGWRQRRGEKAVSFFSPSKMRIAGQASTMAWMLSAGTVLRKKLQLPPTSSQRTHMCNALGDGDSPGSGVSTRL